ncbi:serine/threonine protein kinase [Gurleya vavrai]
MDEESNSKLIGEGTYGKVYKIEKNNTFLAVKQILNDPHHGFPFTAIREIKILKNLRHPNIVTLFDVKTSKNTIKMIMEYMQFDLSGLIINKYKFSDSQIISVIYQISQALAFLHSKNYIHRDVKSSNILLNNDGIVKLADFGLTKKKKQIMTNRVCTLWYRAPELLLGCSKYTNKIDSWSTGIILLEMKGFTFFKGKDEIDQTVRILERFGIPREEYKWSYMLNVEKYKKEKCWYDLIYDQFQDQISNDLMVLVTELLRLNVIERLSMQNILKLRIFLDVKIEKILTDFTDMHEYEYKDKRKNKDSGFN